MKNVKLTRLMKVVCLILLLSSCTGGHLKSQPEERLKDYISNAFSVRQGEDKARLLEFLTHDLKSKLEHTSKEEFNHLFLEQKLEFIKLSFREIKKISKEEVQITYELTYKDLGKNSALTTQKKLCQMVFVNGQWMISDIRNIKEVIEYKNEMTFP